MRDSTITHNLAVVKKSTTVPKLADAINAEHNAAQRDAASAVAHAIRAGELLTKGKASVDHGSWLTWISANCKFSARTATGYMRLAALDRAKQQRVADFSLRQALTEIADSTPRRSAKLRPAAKTGLDREVVHQRELDNPINGETARARQELKEIAALLKAWAAASPATKERFLAQSFVAEEVVRIINSWARAA